MSQAILSIDQGSSGTRVRLYSLEPTSFGQVLYTHEISIHIEHPQDGWVEYTGGTLLQSVIDAIDACLEWAERNSFHVSSIAMSCQRSTCAAWHKTTGELLAPIISWQDRRAADWLDAQDFDTQQIKQLSGLPLSPHYGAAKLRWFFDHCEPVQEAHKSHQLCWGPLTSYLLYQLCEEKPYCVDANIASRTQLWGNQQQRWQSELCNLFNVPAKSLPKVLPSQSLFGHYLSPQLSLNKRTPITLVIGDKHAELASLGLPSSEHAVITLGTCASIFFALSEENCLQQSYWLATRMNCQLQKEDWLAEALVNGMGAALQWFSSQYPEPNNYEEMNQWLDSLTDNQKSEAPLFINSVSGVASPFWVSQVTTRFTHNNAKKEQLFYAVVESMIFWLAWNIELYKNYSSLREIILSGHLSLCNHIGQGLADLSNVLVKRFSDGDFSLQGAAILGCDKNLQESWPRPCADTTYTPQQNQQLGKRYQQWKSIMLQELKMEL